jgi:membrane protein implicated in regulation of membrane protease activity
VLLAWLVLGIVLILVELHHLAFYALFVAVGALAAALVAAFAPEAYVVQGLVAAGVAVVGVIAIRPYAERAYLSHRRTGSVARGVHGGLLGAEAITLDLVGEAHHVGHVRLAGERWLAVSGTGTIPTGTRVVVTAVHGTTLTVWPADSSPSPPHELGTAPEGAEGSEQ